MKIQKFSTESDKDVINSAYNMAFDKYNVPIEERANARDWHFIRHEVSKSMSNVVTGRPSPIMNRGLKPSREVIKLTFQNDDFTPYLYNRKAKTSKQKFDILTKELIRKDININTFKEYAEVLDVSKKQITAVIQQSIKSLFGG